MRDIKYIIKRIIIGVGISLAMMFIRQNVYAYEWETEGDEQITYSYYKGIRYYFSSSLGSSATSVSYPKTLNSNSSTVGNYTSSNTSPSGTPDGFIYGNSRVIGPYYEYGDSFDFSGIEFTPNNNYYVIIPYAYDNDTFTGVSSNVNENLILDESTYSSNSNFITITSAALVFGVTNDLENNANYPYYYYWKINFTVSDTVNDLILYVGDPTDKTITYTAFNTTTFNTYLLKSNLLCNSVQFNNTRCSFRPEHLYKPFVYSHVAGSIIPIDDGNTNVADVTQDIKTQINEIINGEFTENLDFDYLNGGGRPFGESEYSLQDLLMIPFNFLKTFSQNSDACVGVTIPLPYFYNHQFTLPCASTFFISLLGNNLFNLVQNIFALVICFGILFAAYNDIQRALSPKDIIYIDSFLTH